MLLYIILICTYVPGLVYIRGDTGGAIDLVSKVTEAFGPALRFQLD